MYNTNNYKQVAQQFSIQDDMLKFSSEMVASARNKFRKKSYLKNSNQISTQLINSQKTNTRRRLNDQIKADVLSDKGDAVNQAHRIQKQSPLSNQNKRDIFTSVNKNSRYRNGPNSFKIVKSQSLQMQTANKIKEKKEIMNLSKTPQQSTTDNKFQPFLSHQIKNSYRQIQRKHNKNNLTNAGVQSWLNEALIQSSPKLKFDINEQLSGLKAYKIDKSSLLSKSISPDNIKRLYRSLFVYSLGFNNFLDELCHNNWQIRQSIWKVFAVLLEYCSQGNFETTIGNIERDKQAKLQSMRSQVEARQKIIQNNDEITDQKNSKLKKQSQKLQQQTKQLRSQRDGLKQDFQQMQQAFHEEIELRLKYQSKINIIHGVHQSLQQKYILLRQQNEKYVKELKQFGEYTDELRKTALENKIVIQQQEAKIVSLQSQRKLIYSTILNMEESTKMVTENYLAIKGSLESYKTQMAEKNRKIQHLQAFLTSSQNSEKSLISALKCKSQQLELTIKENALLQDQIYKCSVTIDEIMQQKRQLGHQGTSVASLVAIQMRKVRQLQTELRKANTQIKQVTQSQRLKDTMLNTEIEKNKSLQADLDSNQQSRKNMKSKQKQLEDLLQQANNKIQSLSQNISQKQKQYRKYTLEIENLKKKLQQQISLLRFKESRISILEENIKSQNDIWEMKYSKVSDELQLGKKKWEKYKEEKDRLQAQLFEAKEKYQKMYVEYKNEKFERNNLDLYYKQSLSVMEEQIEHIKKLNIQISEMTEVIQQSKRKYFSLQLIHKHKTEMLESDANFWKSKYDIYQKQLRHKENFVHPLRYEDICSKLVRLADEKFKIEQDMKKTQITNDKYERQIFVLEQKLKLIQKKSMQQSEKVYRKMISKIQQQLKFVKEKLIYQNHKLTELQSSLSKETRERLQALQKSRAVQSQYMEKIKEKSMELQELNGKYRALVQLNEDQLKQNNSIINRYEMQKKQLRERHNILEIKLKAYESQMRQRLITNQEKKKSQQNEHNINNASLNLKKPKKSTQSKQKQEQRQKTTDLAKNNYNDERSGWEHQIDDEGEAQQKLQSKNVAENPKFNNMQVELNESEQKFKKRQSISKLIQGAYLYYKN